LGGQIVVGKTAREFFRESVVDALSHRRMRIQQETEFYLVNLLADFLDRGRLYRPAPGGGEEREPLALMLVRALAADRAERYRELKRLGDTSLFVSGFFSDSLHRGAVGVDYYIAMGERAYGSLSEGRLAPAGLDELYGELARRFPDFVDLFAEIAELAELRSNRGLVRLYRRFLHTGSARIAERLRERGVALFAGPGPARDAIN
jgi:hypothetical protein